ncbi:MAG: hypothetical protein Q7K43_03555, partial [Candidatus Woesearchaeota archaeon]|nr:hypothetical protein [Candidatus Woesearchaeota archaeon]
MELIALETLAQQILTDIRKVRDAELANKSAEEVVRRHILDFVEDTKGAKEAGLNALKKAIDDGRLSSANLAEVHKIEDIPRFSEIKEDTLTGMHLYERGTLVIEQYLLGAGKTVRIFHSIFSDHTNRIIAETGQTCFAAIAEKAKTIITDYTAEEAMRRLVPLLPVFSGGNTLSNLFLEGQDLHTILRNSSPREKYTHLSALANIDAIMNHAAIEFRKTKKGKRMLAKLPRKNHTSRLPEVLSRCSTTFRTRYTANPKLIKELSDAIDCGNEDYTFSHGDALPSNVMVTPEGYTPIDFEFSCQDYPEAVLVQRMAKAGVHKSDGVLVLLNDESIEELVLKDYALMARKVDKSFDEKNMRERYEKLKAENLLVWAARFSLYSQNNQVKNAAELKEHSRYYYTLFVKELVAQKKAKNNEDPVFDETSALFDKPLSDEELAKFNPHYRYHSLIDAQPAQIARSRLEKIIQNHKRQTWYKRAKQIVAGLFLAVGISAGVIEYSNVKDNTVKLSNKLAQTTEKLSYAKKLKIIRAFEAQR